MKIKGIALLLTVVILVSCAVSGCGLREHDCKGTKELRAFNGDNVITEPMPLSLYTEKFNDFAARLFSKTSENGKNTLVSPLSVVYALAMLTEGADGETLKQLENALGLEYHELRMFCHSYLQSAVNGDDNLTLANSLWINSQSGFEPKEDFIKINKHYYSSDVEEMPFDKDAEDKINKWVGEKTKGIIPKAVDDIGLDAVMVLVNALGFEGDWETPYQDFSIEKGEFTSSNGKTSTVDFMNSTEDLFLEDEMATGFIKYYEGRDYAFVAMLPKEGVKVEDYVNCLNGKNLTSLLEGAEEKTVYAALPEFESEFSKSIKDTLADMGVKDCFDSNLSDLSYMGEMKECGNVYVSEVTHSTEISVFQQGTKAGAVTAEIACATGLATDIKEVTLGRPFVYMLVDTRGNIPLFTGVLNEI